MARKSRKKSMVNTKTHPGWMLGRMRLNHIEIQNRISDENAMIVQFRAEGVRWVDMAEVLHTTPSALIKRHARILEGIEQ